MHREVRLYGLFERSEDGKHWVRLSPTLAFKKRTAVRIFQNALLANVRERRLRVVKEGQ